VFVKKKVPLSSGNWKILVILGTISGLKFNDLVFYLQYYHPITLSCLLILSVIPTAGKFVQCYNSSWQRPNNVKFYITAISLFCLYFTQCTSFLVCV